MAVTNSGPTLYTDNDSEAGWVGTNGPSAEVFWQGVESEFWIVFKTAIEEATLTKTAVDMSGSKYFSFGFLSTIASFYNTIKLRIQTDASNYEEFLLADRTTTALTYRAINGVFILGSPVIQLGQGTITGTFNPASVGSIWIEVDNSTSGNIRSVENHYIDAMYYGNGRSIGGTTTTDKLFTESNELNISGDVLDCYTMAVIGSKTIIAMTDITVTTTLGNSYGESLEFREVPNTDNIYTLSVTGTADFQASSFSAGSVNVTVNLDTSGATSWQILGGSVVGAGTTEFKASQVIDSAVFTDRTSITHNGSLFENNVVNTSGIMAVASTGTCTNNVYNAAAGTSAITCSDLSHAPVNTFISSGTGHAVDLGTVATSGTMTWNSNDTGYTAASSGNETIKVNYTDTGADLVISVSAGYTTPSVYNIGAGIVTVVSGQATYTQTMQDQITLLPIQGVAVTVKPKDATGPLPYQESVTITSNTGIATVAHTAHGFNVGHKVEIKGALENEYNRIKTILTVPTADSYTYAVFNTPTSPATGTITSTAIIIDAITDVNGQVSDTRGYSGTDQPISGDGKKGSSLPVYKSAPITGTIDSGNGVSITTLMISD